MRKYFLLFHLFLGFTCFSCKDSENAVSNPPAIQIKQDSSRITKNPGDVVSFNIELSSEAGLKELQIKKIINGQVQSDVEMIPFAGKKNAVYPFRYSIETLKNNSTIDIIFQVNDMLNQGSLRLFTILVKEKPIYKVFTNIMRDTTWRAGSPIFLERLITVTNGATLTIEAGSIIKGKPFGTGLVIDQGSKIIATGTPEKPIIFTSANDKGKRDISDWGGVEINGNAPVNNPYEVGYLSFKKYGGNNPNDNSGILKYVRIEFAGDPGAGCPGFPASLSLNGVGSGTIIEHVEVAYGFDDGFQIRGGTFNASYLISYGTRAEDWDIASGYNGKIQFGLAIRNMYYANFINYLYSNSIRIRNDLGATLADQPFTYPQLSNFTIIGPKKDRNTSIDTYFGSAILIRGNGKAKIYNSFFTGFPSGILLVNKETFDNVTGGSLFLKNNILTGVEQWGGNGFGTAGTIFAGSPANGSDHPSLPRGYAVDATETLTTYNNLNRNYISCNIYNQTPETWFKTNNELLDKWQEAGIDISLFESPKPVLIPVSGSKLLSGADFNGLNLQSLEQVTFRGAFGNKDWTEKWANFDPKNTDY